MCWVLRLYILFVFILRTCPIYAGLYLFSVEIKYSITPTLYETCEGVYC